MIDNLYRPESSATISLFLSDTIIGKCAEEAAVNRQFPLETSTLMALSVASHAVSMAHCVTYPNGDRLPVGLYAIGEQPAGTAKTSVLNYFLDGIYGVMADINKARLEVRKQVLKSEKENKVLNEFEELELIKNHKIDAPLTDTTPEALDSILGEQFGWFMAASTEQALANSLIGGMYSDKGSNFDVLLKGFNAEWHSSSRVTRAGFSGKPHGGVLCISQDGVIDTVLGNSSSTGLCERFLIILEGNMFGKRNHDAAGSCGELYRGQFREATKETCLKLHENESMCIDDLKPISISKLAWKMIISQKQDMEDSLADNEKYSASMFRGMWSKMDIQIMKIAATLHIYSGFESSKPIGVETIKVAIAITKEMLRGVVSICEEKGFIGKTVEEEEVEEYMSKNGRMGKSENEILKAISKRKAFKQYGKSARNRAKDALQSLVNRGTIQIITTGNVVRMRYSG